MTNRRHSPDRLAAHSENGIQTTIQKQSPVLSSLSASNSRPHHIPKNDSLSRRLDEIRKNLGNDGLSAPWDAIGKPLGKDSLGSKK